MCYNIITVKETLKTFQKEVKKMTVREMIGKTACGTNVIVMGDSYHDSYSKPDYEKYFPEYVLDSEVTVVRPCLSGLEIRFEEKEW